MLIDDFIDRYPDLSFQGYYLKDSVHFKIENSSFSETDRSIVEYHIEDIKHSLYNPDYKINHFVKFSKPFSAPLSNPCYENMSIEITVNENGKSCKQLYWILTSINNEGCRLLLIHLNKPDKISFHEEEIKKVYEKEYTKRGAIIPTERVTATVVWLSNNLIDLNNVYFIDITTNCIVHIMPIYVIVKIMSLVQVIRACAIINCINIEKVYNEIPEKLQKARIKRGKLPLLSYYTLQIKNGKYYQSRGKQDLWTNRIHLCRGHFKTYTSDRPLMGKFTGTFWWQAMARGKNKKGIVVKDYELKK